MGLSRLNQVIATLQVAGIRTERGFVSTPMPEPSAPVAAVFTGEMTSRESTVAVVVYTTAAQGGILCEDTALLVLQKLIGLGGVCRMGDCSFDGKTGLFSVKVTATFPELLPFGVLVADTRLEYLTELEIVRQTELNRVKDEQTGEEQTVLRDNGWKITLTELLPPRTPPDVHGSGLFSIMVEHPGGAELYDQCQWESSCVTRTTEGMCRVRVARTWAEKDVAAG